ncbi:MAG TPA: hypothetical protein VKB12_21235 [Pyrinomonadaceae bacterium]|nr:hypothetical protein [Pyrinomonadaceae bacterium]
MRARVYIFVLTLSLCLAALAPFAPLSRSTAAQTLAGKNFRPDHARALAARQPDSGAHARKGAYASRSAGGSSRRLARANLTGQGRHNPARPTPVSRTKGGATSNAAASASPANVIAPGTPLSRVLHVSQLSLIDDSGTHEEFVDRDGDLQADDRTTFDARGGSYDIAVGRTGARYEAFTAIDDRGTGTTSDNVSTGVLVVALDTNGDYVRDTSQTFDLGRDFGLPSAASVVAGTSRAGREFVVVSSSGFFNEDDANDPNNEPSPGVVLLVRDSSTGGFDSTRSRKLVTVGDNRLFNANAMTLLPRGDLVIADFHSNELRVVRDTDDDGVPDTLLDTPYYSFQFSDDAPLDIASNSRGVVFTHSSGGDTFLLAVYDTDGDGFADKDEAAVEGLSIDNNLFLHGLTVARDGTVYVIQDALGESDLPADGGNGGIPHVYAFPDPALNGVLREGAAFVLADDEFTQAYSGLAFGVETVLPPVAHVNVTNSASMRGDAPSGGLATLTGTSLTRGRSGLTQTDATASNVRVEIEGLSVPVLSFDDSTIHIQVPQSLGTGVGTFVVKVSGDVTAAEDAGIVNANPGVFTVPQTGAGESVALLVSGLRYTPAPFDAKTGGQPSEVALFGTGWRNSLPVTVQIGGKPAAVTYAGTSGGLPGLDQIDVVIPDGVTGPASVVVKTADGSTSRADVFITVQ